MTSSAAVASASSSALVAWAKRRSDAAGHRNEFGQDAVELLLVLVSHGDDRRQSGLIMGGGEVNAA